MPEITHLPVQENGWKLPCSRPGFFYSCIFPTIRIFFLIFLQPSYILPTYFRISVYCLLPAYYSQGVPLFIMVGVCTCLRVGWMHFVVCTAWKGDFYINSISGVHFQLQHTYFALSMGIYHHITLKCWICMVHSGFFPLQPKFSVISVISIIFP